MRNNPLLMLDGYKTSHHRMYPEGTTLVYSNYTPRSVKRMPEQAKEIVVFGSQYVIKFIHELYQENFFNLPKEEVCNEAKVYLSSYLGCDYDVSHFEALHDLGYLPLEVKSLTEGTIIGERIPTFTIYNTHKDFYWLPNFLETLISSLMWKPMHSASMAYGYKKILTKYAKETDANNLGFVDFQAHDFSFRGMQHPESAISSGLGFLTSFSGTDTVPSLQAAKHYYNGENVGYSVPASEHAIMASGTKEGEIDTVSRLMDVYPTGVLSLVMDTWDITNIVRPDEKGTLVQLKEKILNRDGKLVIRPDSAPGKLTPADIICGHNEELSERELEAGYPEFYRKGLVECLWDIFGGTINEQGYKVLHSNCGAIYGDAVSLDIAEDTCRRLKEKGFATTNVIYGVGSFSMGFATRDSQGGAVKATYIEVNGESRNIFKDPISDDGTKKSATGLLKVHKDVEGNITLEDKVDWTQSHLGELKIIYLNGKFSNQTTLTEIRERING